MSLLDKILLGVGAAVAFVVAIIIVWLSIANAHLHAEFAELQANNTACHSANDDFAAAVAKQNKTLVALQTENAARAKRAAAALQAAQKTAALYEADSERLRRAKATGDLCQAAAALFAPYLAGKQ